MKSWEYQKTSGFVPQERLLNIQTFTNLHSSQISSLRKAYLPTHVFMWVWREGEKETFTWKEEIHGLVDINVQIDV